MKKMKKIMALLLTAVMVMGMSLTAFAAPSEETAEAPSTAIPANASITINHLTPNDNTIVKIYKVVEHDAQNSCWKAVYWAKDKVSFENGPNATIDWASLKDLAANQEHSGSATLSENQTSVTFNDLEAGAYLVVASGTKTTYNVMGVATYKYDENSNLLVPLAAEISAKGAGYKVTKTLKGDATLVHRGQELTFNIDSVFPSFADGTTDRQVSITDAPTGQYVKEMQVYVGDMKKPLVEGRDYTLSFNKESHILPAKVGEEVTVNFTKTFIGEANEHAGQTIRVDVTTVVDDVETIANKAYGSHDSIPEDSKVETSTGSITISKVGKDREPLTGAKFSFKLHSDDHTQGKPNEGKLQFVKVDDGKYKFATDTDTEEKVSDLEVNSKTGILTVTGLGQGKYHITEEKAPDGYSVVDVEDVTLSLENANAAFPVVNTKLSSLPSTGGIGTTIFTIAGCVIMIAAAGMFFANRKKDEK